jgi:ribosomal protein L31E
MCSSARILIKNKVMRCMDCDYIEMRPKTINWLDWTWHHSCTKLKGKVSVRASKIESIMERYSKLEEESKELEQTDIYKGLMNT